MLHATQVTRQNASPKHSVCCVRNMVNVQLKSNLKQSPRTHENRRRYESHEGNEKTLMQGVRESKGVGGKKQDK